MQELNLKLFTLVNATSDTALWMIDWGRFFTWWPQLIVMGGLALLLFRRNRCGVEWLTCISAAVLLATGINHFVSWGHPVELPVLLDVGQFWMKGAAFGSWMGSYPVFLPTIFFASLTWNKGYLFAGWIFSLTVANIWGLLLTGCYFPTQIFIGVIIGFAAVGGVISLLWLQSKLRSYVLVWQGRIEPVS